MRRVILVIPLLLIVALSGAAQDSDGQFCVRSYEDRNANQIRDAGEPLLTSGIGADLLDESGITVASALLAESPTAAQGVICFQFLPPGQYTIQVTSAEYSATTPETMTVTLRGGELPSVLEFGAQSITAVPLDAPASEAAATGPDWPRIGVAALGAVLALLAMQILGLMIYTVRYRRRKYRVVEKKDADSSTGRFKRPVS